MAMPSDEQAVAFNRGVQGRIDGLPLSANPHALDGYRSKGTAFDYWRQGWMDCHLNFGREAKGWVKPLPEVRS